MESAHRRLRETADNLILAKACLRSLTSLAGWTGEPVVEQVAGILRQLYVDVSMLVLYLPHWIEYAREETIRPLLLVRLDELDALEMPRRLAEMETLAFADDILSVSDPLAILSTEFKMWYAEFKVETQQKAYFEAFTSSA